jgi:hypothetical protein
VPTEAQTKFPFLKLHKEFECTKGSKDGCFFNLKCWRFKREICPNNFFQMQFLQLKKEFGFPLWRPTGLFCWGKQSLLILSNVLSHVWVWLQTGFGLVIGFIEHSQILTTSDYSAIVNSHILQLNAARTVFSVCCIFNGCRLVTVSNAVASSASVFTSLLAGDCLTIN